jgi:hypothetical protein
LPKPQPTLTSPAKPAFMRIWPLRTWPLNGTTPPVAGNSAGGTVSDFSVWSDMMLPPAPAPI